MKPDIEELRKKYIKNPPEGMTSEDIRHMSGDDLLDMDYFLNEETLLTICLEKKVFISSKSNHRPIVMSIPLLIRHMFDQQGFFFPYPKSEFPIK